MFLSTGLEIGAAENLPLHRSSSHHIPSAGVLGAVAHCLGDLAAYPFYLQEKVVLKNCSSSSCVMESLRTVEGLAQGSVPQLQCVFQSEAFVLAEQVPLKG